MFSYLRPHRRSPSTPTSPVPEQQQHPLESSLRPPGDHAQQSLRTRRSFGHFSKSTLHLHSPNPPPVSRVYSPHEGQQDGLRELQEEDVVEDMKMQWKESHGTAYAREPLTLRTNGQADRPMSAGRTTDTSYYKPQNGNSVEQTQNFMANNLQDLSSNTEKRPSAAHFPTSPPIIEVSTSKMEASSDPAEKRKSKRNILNPMSLLARRRTSQAVPQLTPPQPLTNLNNKPPALYDPSIRGTKVHDFSAPRNRRNVSYSDLSTSKNGKSPRGYGERDVGERPWSGGNHTPVFKEDFDEEQYPAAGPHVRKASDLTDLDKPRPPFARNSNQNKPSKTDSPVIEKLDSSPPAVEPRHSLPPPPPVPVLPGKEGPEEAPEPLSPTAESKAQKRTDSTTKPTEAPSQKRRSRAISEVSTSEVGTLQGLPKHMKSTSSRFSFDMIGAAKQEKLLEDRHRQKAAEKKAASPTEEESEGEFDDFDYDGMMDDDGLEERIPGVNADFGDDDDDDDGFSEDDAVPLVGSFTGFTFHSMATPAQSPMTPYSPAMLPTPRDASGQVIGFAYSKESPEIGQNMETQLPISSELPMPQIQVSPSIETDVQGLGLVGIDYDTTEEKRQDGETLMTPTSFTAPPIMDDDDDLYFDDGIIDNLPEDLENNAFDESVFDAVDTDQYGRPLRSFTQPFGPSEQHIDPERSNTPSTTGDSARLETHSETSADHTEKELNSVVRPVLEIDTKGLLSRQSTLSPSANNVLAPRPSIAELNSSIDPVKSDITRPSTDLTHDSLAAYQSALAAAAYKAAANGKFNRNTSPATTFDERDEMADHPGLIPDSGRQSEELFSPSYDATYDDFNYDDELEDDDIIAAANAEALAYDCDGFYGQEFGFYSAPPSLPSTNGSSEYIHGMGGYFGPRGDGTITRSMSGRIAMREPNLTPITERSEYSNRNSIMSLQLQGFDARNSITSPGLAQLAGMMSPYDEENMSLGALMKLRRGAWGGSQASLHSREGSDKSVGDREDRDRPSSASPLNWEKIPSGQQQTNGIGHVRQNSNFSLASDFESRGSIKSNPVGSLALITNTLAPIVTTTIDAETPTPDSPVLMMASIPSSKSRQQKRRSSEAKPISPVYERAKERDTGSVEEVKGTAAAGGMKRSHRKTGSTDSISYMKEEDPVTGERWVLERRRTGSSGEVEVLGREIVLGGRI